MSVVHSRLAELGLALPSAAAPVANDLGTKRSGDLLFVPGRMSALRGKAGSQASAAAARLVARDTLLDLLGIMAAAVQLDLVLRLHPRECPT